MSQCRAREVGEPPDAPADVTRAALPFLERQLGLVHDPQDGAHDVPLPRPLFLGNHCLPVLPTKGQPSVQRTYRSSGQVVGRIRLD